MTLRSLTFLVLIPSFIITFVCVWIFFSVHYRESFHKEELQQLRKQEIILASYAKKNISRLSITAKDWAVWDDTYQFMQDKNQAYINSNLVPATLESLNADALFFMDNGMNLFYSITNEEETQNIPAIAKEMKNSSKSIDSLGNRRMNFFFLKLPKDGKTYAAVYYRITDSKMINPPTGYFVILLSLEAFLANSYDNTGFEIINTSFENTESISYDYFAASSHIEPSNATIKLKAPVINTNEMMVLSFRIDRSQFIFIDGMIINTIFAVMGIFIITASLVTVLMNVFVMKKISRLTSEFKNIKESPVFDRRLPEGGIYELNTLAKTANAAMDDIRDLNKKLLMMTNIDGLTGVPNRRFFDSSYDKEFKRALRNGHEISIIMIDIDHFKKFNDTYGHINGDECLKTVAKIISQSLQRPADLTARFGGEEFIIVLPETGKEGAKFIAESIRQTILGTEIQLSSGVTTKVTVSLGISTSVPDKTTSKESLIENADIALYTAKRNRNCTKHFGEDA